MTRGAASQEPEGLWLPSPLHSRSHCQLVDLGNEGNGCKTLLAKALAAEAGASFHYASGASFIEKYVGVGPQRVWELFARARQSAPAIIFIDEIDSIGRSRTAGENAEWDSTLNQLLTEIDGFSSTDNVLLVCATNRRELLDSALLRPGRLDRQVYIGLPDLPARVAILQVHTRKKPLAADVDLHALARHTPGLSGAHLAWPGWRGAAASSPRRSGGWWPTMRSATPRWGRPWAWAPSSA